MTSAHIVHLLILHTVTTYAIILPINISAQAKVILTRKDFSDRASLKEITLPSQGNAPYVIAPQRCYYNYCTKNRDSSTFKALLHREHLPKKMASPSARQLTEQEFVRETLANENNFCSC